MQALSIDAGLLRSLHERPWRGRMHSVFERVVNLQDDEGGLMTLASRDLDNAPNTLPVDVAGFGGTGLAGGAGARVTSQAIAAGTVEVRIDAAATWRTALPSWPLGAARLRRNLGELRAGAAASLGARNADGAGCLPSGRPAEPTASRGSHRASNRFWLAELDAASAP